MRLLSTILLFLYFFHLPLNAAEPTCSELLLHITKNGEHFVPWTDLKSELNYRHSATLLVKIPLNDLRTGLDALTKFDPSLRSPLNFITIADNSLHLIVDGRSEDLIALREDSRFVEASFQILGSEVKKRSFTLSLPGKIVEIRDHKSSTLEKLRNTLLRAPAERLSILDGSTGQVFFIVGRDELTGVTREVYKKLGITYEKTAPELDVVSWLADGSDRLAGSLIVQNGRSWILSQAAFHALKTLEGKELNLAASSSVKVAKALRDQLRQCLEPICVIDTPEPSEPPAEITVSMAEEIVLRNTPGLLEKMMDAWSAAAGHALTGQDALAKTAEHLGDKKVPESKRQLYRSRLDDIDFGTRDGRSLLELARDGRGKYQVAVRFIQAWKALDEALAPGNRARELTPESAESLIGILNGKVPAAATSTAPAVAPAPALAPAPASAATKKANVTLSSKEVGAFLKFLAQHSEVQVSKPGYMTEGFDALLTKILTGEALSDAKAKIAKIKFLDSDMINARYYASPQGRLIDGIRIVGESAGFTETQINGEYIAELIKNFRIPAAPPDDKRAAAEETQKPPVKIKLPLRYSLSEFTSNRMHQDMLRDGPKQLGEARPFALVTFYNTNAWGIIDGAQLTTRPVEDVLAELEKTAGVKLADGIRERVQQALHPDQAKLKTSGISGQAGSNRLLQLVDEGDVAVVADKKTDRWYVIAPFASVKKKKEAKAKEPARSSDSSSLPPPPKDFTPKPAPPPAKERSAARVPHPTSAVVSFEKPPVGRDQKIDLDDLKDFILHNAGYAIPAGVNDWKLLYNSTRLTETVNILFNFTEIRPNELDIKIVGMYSISDTDQNYAWSETANFHHIKGVQLPFAHPVVIGSKRVEAVTIRGSVLAKLLIKHDLTMEEIESVVAECRSTVRDGEGFRADVQLNKVSYKVFFALNGDHASVKTMFPVTAR